jgi:hypothetical protein
MQALVTTLQHRLSGTTVCAFTLLHAYTCMTQYTSLCTTHTTTIDMSFDGFDFDGYMTAITLGFPAGNPVISQPTLWTPSKDNPGTLLTVYCYVAITDT